MTPTDRLGTAVAWRSWGREAFAEARATGRPVLLAIGASWSDGAREMDRTTWADAELAAALAESCVAIRVDADERPDVAERYLLGGVPTTAFLTPDGFVIGGGTMVDAAALRAALPRAAVAATAHAAPLRHDADACSVPSGHDDALESLLVRQFDAVHGGLGTAPKFPHVAAIRWALDEYHGSGDAGMLVCATRALDAMGWGALYDEEAGGFFRYCDGADWTRPRREKVLSVNAALLDLYVHAATVSGTDRWMSRAADTLAFLERDLRRHDGAWRVSSGSAASRVFSDVNAAAVSAVLHAARAFEDDELAARALRTLEDVLLACYKPGAGVSHFAGGPRGLLADQLAMAGALLDAWDTTGNVVYQMMAEELARYVLRVMADDEAGGLFDRAPSLYADEPQGPASSCKPFAVNCGAVLLLSRLADASADTLFAEAARRTLASVESDAPAQGPDIAHYLIARRAVLR